MWEFLSINCSFHPRKSSRRETFSIWNHQSWGWGGGKFASSWSEASIFIENLICKHIFQALSSCEMKVTKAIELFGAAVFVGVFLVSGRLKLIKPKWKLGNSPIFLLRRRRRLVVSNTSNEERRKKVQRLKSIFCSRCLSFNFIIIISHKHTWQALTHTRVAHFSSEKERQIILIWWMKHNT